MEKFLTGDVWKQINKLLFKKEKKIACIAYVTSENLRLSKGDILVCDASEYEIRFGSTSAKTLNSYFKKGVLIYSNQALHSKLLLSNSFLVVGSANLSNRSASTLVESAIVSNNDVLLSQAKAFCHNLLNESILVTKEHLEKILRINVIKRSFKPKVKSSVREKKFGSNFWYIPIGEMTDSAYKKVENKIDSSKQKVVTTTEFSEDEIESIYFKSETSFSVLAKEGDQILMNWHNKNKSRRYVFPFATILRIDRENGETIFIYDNTGAGMEYSFSKFVLLTKKLGLEKQLSNPRTKKISENDAKKLKSLWK